jgi:colanic acid/amylovoran biosynthesis glycosyltransferase
VHVGAEADGKTPRGGAAAHGGGPAPSVCVYTRYFLPSTQTFVYRQLLGVQPAWAPFVVTTRRDNADLFPFAPVVVLPGGRLTRDRVRFYDRALQHRVAPFWGRQRRLVERVLGERAPSLLHAHFGTGALAIQPAARAAGVPLLVTFHGYDASTMLTASGYRAQLRGLFKSAHVIAVSGEMANRLVACGADPTRLVVHHIGVPLETFPFRARASLPDKVAAGETVEFLQVSSFNEKKGHEYTVAAFRRFLEDGSRARLTFVGDGPRAAHIRAAAADLEARGAVRFLGLLPQDEVARVMAEADVFVHHSVTSSTGDKEGIPIGLMEAMASGLLVVSTRHSGIPELVEDGVEGYLVDERDVAAYAAAMRRALAAGPEVAAAARRKIERDFDIDTQNRRLAEIYSSVADAGR